ncbi:hypothetical protein [Catelliglobosispora koreensis]|uniref:hypothetical protein n=1 Tax=Catelliglobosispora koreensis TaxID=129052 RepID=UPI0004780D02|nr:hypothetical protein [Catelliglobosispora koreensis]
MLRRIAVLTATGFLAMLPAASALAANPGPGVNFTGGGLGLLLCGSKPDAPRITVGAESKIRLTNSLGMGAELRIDGSPSATLASGETVEVQFHRGPVAVTMVPDCALNLNPKFEQLTVDVTPTQANPAPAKPAPAQSKPAAKPSTGVPGNAQPGSSPGAALPELPEDPLFPGAVTNVPGGTPDGSGGTLESSPATVVNSAKKPTSTSGPVDKGPIGLLAIIATVCVVGVSAGAIRAIITQRATRAEFA